MVTPRLLVVDDHPDTLRLFESYLSFAGFDVVAVTRATDALERDLTIFDAIATDLAMPGMDGFEFIRSVRGGSCPATNPIVAITGQAIDPEKVLPKDIGCCRLLLKPCDLEQLAEVLRFLVAHCVHDCERCPHRTPPGGATRGT